MFASLLVIFAAVVFSTRRLLRYLHIFQQEEYDARRFVQWLFTQTAFDKKLSAALLLLVVAAAGMTIVPWVLQIAIAVAFLAFAAIEPDPRKEAKKRLALTERATRILGVAFLLNFTLTMVAFLLGGKAFWIALVQLIPFTLVAGNWMLSPYEKRVQDGFRRRAEARLREVGPTVIGITGSFGKTSVKHILGHVLQLNTSALFTPGSVNTVMGISRIINERLDNGCKYFIVEMGAYGKGSIERLCNFTPPDHGILTSIGAAHYERFKDLETVAEAKFELATAVKQHDGKMIIDEQILDRAHAERRVGADRASFVIVGQSADADIRIKSITQTPNGLDVQVQEGGGIIDLFAPLFGAHHGRNMALAYALARTIGISADRIKAALRSTPQIAHRLEVKRAPSGVVYLDDAYNSNPSGFANALDLMQLFRQGGGRRILITPGMAELGEKHDASHRELGVKAAESVDLAVVVKPQRIPTFLEGLRAGPTPPEILTFEQFSEARAWLDGHAKAGDVVLIENDLPDLYERRF
ncbi:MAG: UDP-N-acetylmuramoyl-tripeptide--D-alanyl-D-alanine ligase, partial [Alphaproteobacteria bacterium]|nr:UDP-N-acetylmuramoyl-tripeptide--D-alanyl-D-alanine ligase [Alphaproteobacteria bacterium]